MREDTAPLELSPPRSTPSSIYSDDSSEPSIDGHSILMDRSNSSIHSSIAYSLDDHVSGLESLKNNDLRNEAAIMALPRRRKKSQRPLVIQLAKILYPDLPEIAAVIRYDRLTSSAKTIVLARRKERAVAQSQPKSQSKLLDIQGPWAGQDVDPLDLKGPVAIPMPVTIGKTTDFEPIFSFLSEDKAITQAANTQGTHGLELTWKNPTLEFKRGIVYEDGRLDLCKKVVGPTHIGNLMESLESNHQIRHFLLGNNVISTTGAKRIAEFIHRHPDHMETWYLAGCHITHHGLSLLVPEMITSSTITNLWFKRNPFGSNSSSLLAELVLQTKQLRTLDLETTELGNEGTRHFIDTICGHTTSLQHLYLNANGIGQSACASLATYLADPHCALESLFMSTNPIGDAGMHLLAPGVAKNKTLKRLMCASAGLTSRGVQYLASALSHEDHPLITLDLGASQTTKAHAQKFNYFDDSCLDDLKTLIMLPHLRWLNLGRTALSAEGLQEIRSAAAHSELVFLDVHRVQSADTNSLTDSNTEEDGGVPVAGSCSLEVRNQMAKNQAKYYPHFKDYNEFLQSGDLRYLRNTSDVRKIDSMYRTRDRRLGLPMDMAWEEGDPTWKLILEDAEMAERA
ncbi:hypothetical protein EDD21DRAFT_361587 [Dissophora ornata]|nr:hypothetical protein BGZ58_009021 [Dissophora ornata]KAI8606218.1 hypothetical protein EDD21DRAFT_361587 [Dissophora ornata]